MRVRRMRIEDYAKVHDLWLHTPGMGLNNLDDSEAGIATFLKRNPTTCFVAEADDKLIGVIMSGHDGRRGYIYHLAVAVSERCKGIGTELVNKTMDALAEEGIKKVALVVFSKNEDGNHFWQNRGFELRSDLNYRNKALADIQRIDT